MYQAQSERGPVRCPNTYSIDLLLSILPPTLSRITPPSAPDLGQREGNRGDGWPYPLPDLQVLSGRSDSGVSSVTPEGWLFINTSTNTNSSLHPERFSTLLLSSLIFTPLLTKPYLQGEMTESKVLLMSLFIVSPSFARFTSVSLKPSSTVAQSSTAE